MTKLIKRIIPALLLTTSAAVVAESDLSAQVQMEWRFDGTSVQQNSWNAHALVGHQLRRSTQTLPVYKYTLNSDGTSFSQLFGGSMAVGLNPLNAAGSGRLPTIMMVAGFAAAGLVLAEELSDDDAERPTAGGGLGLPGLPIALPELPIDLPLLPEVLGQP